MAVRSVASPAGACRTECCRASKLTGRLVGDEKSTLAWGTNEKPVIAPPALRLTSAVACCHQGLLARCTGFTSSLMAQMQMWTADDAARDTGVRRGRRRNLGGRSAQGESAEAGRWFRMSCTCGSPGFFAFWNSTAAAWAAAAGAPTTHLR